MKKLFLALSITACAAAATTGAMAVIGNVSADEGDTLLSELKVGKYYLSGGTDEQYIEVYPDETICLYGYEGERCETSSLFENRNSYVIDTKVPFIGIDDGVHSPIVGYTYTGTDVINFSDYGVLEQYIFREDETEQIPDSFTAEGTEQPDMNLITEEAELETE